MRRAPRTLAAAVLVGFLAQATGAASLPALVIAPPGAFLRAPMRAPAPAKSPPAQPAAGGIHWLETARDPAPVAEPPSAPRDRMLVVMEPGVRVVGVGRDAEDFSAPPRAALEAPGAPPLPPQRERWMSRAGVRARLSYLRAHGVVRGFPDGYVATFADGRKHYAAASLTAPYLRAFPIYWHGEEIEVELELVNETGRDLRGLTVEAVQETFRPVGGEGMRLSPPAQPSAPAVLPAGGRAVLRWFVRLEGPSHATVNLEQTHVRVSAGPSSGGATLLDAPQAGVIDPPGPGLL